jgi:hypothetical protein
MAQDIRLMYPHRYEANIDSYIVRLPNGERLKFTPSEWKDPEVVAGAIATHSGATVPVYTFGWSDPRGASMTSLTYKTAIDDAVTQMQLFINNPFEENVLKMDYVGSRVTCVPAPTDTDEDVLVLTDNVVKFVNSCTKAGFKETGSYAGSAFYSLRQGEVNLIITDEEEFYEKFMLATHVCKSLNVLDKQHRITVFQAILYGKAYGKP